MEGGPVSEEPKKKGESTGEPEAIQERTNEGAQLWMKGQ